MPSSRRDFLALLGAAGGAGLAGCATVGIGDDEPPAATETAVKTETEPVAGPHSWPMFQHDRHNSGHADTTGPTPPVTDQWPPLDRYPRPTPADAPAVVEDTVYFTYPDTSVYALSAADGSQRWAFSPDRYHRLSPRQMGTPAVVDGTVYVASAPEDEGTLYALAAADGSEQWRFQTDGEIWSAPTVVEDTVYVGGGAMHALSAADGSEQWTAELGGGVASAPAVVEDTVYVGSGDGTVYALSASDGAEQWRFQTDGEIWSAPTVVEDTVYVGSTDSRLYAVSAADGTEQWTFETGDKVAASPAVADGTVYVGSDDEHVYALSAADGTEQWRHTLNGKVSNGAPVMVDDTVYVGSYPTRDKGDHILYALAAGDGTEQWTYEAKRFRIMSPAVVDGTVYLGPVALG